MINMRISKDNEVTCNCCGKDGKESVQMFDMRIQIPKQSALILHICDKCVSEMFDKTLKARCMVDSMVKSSKQMAIINGRKRTEMKEREYKQKQEAEKMKRRRYAGDGD